MEIEVLREVVVPPKERVYAVKRTVTEGVIRPYDVYWCGPDDLFGTTWTSRVEDAAVYPRFGLAVREFVRSYRRAGRVEIPSATGPLGVVPIWRDRR
jgi:hypothetical protein